MTLRLAAVTESCTAPKRDLCRPRQYTTVSVGKGDQKITVDSRVDTCEPDFELRDKRRYRLWTHEMSSRATRLTSQRYSFCKLRRAMQMQHQGQELFTPQLWQQLYQSTVKEALILSMPNMVMQQTLLRLLHLLATHRPAHLRHKYSKRLSS